MFSWVHDLQVESKNRSKIEQKSITGWKGLPTSIFSGFWWILEAKLGRKIEPRQDKTGQDRARKGKTRQDKDQGKTRQDFGRQRDAGDPGRWGVGGVRPAIRGIPPQGSGPLVSRGSGTPSYDFLAILMLSTFPSLFRCLLGSILAPFSLPTCFQKSTKIN